MLAVPCPAIKAGQQVRKKSSEPHARVAISL